MNVLEALVQSATQDIQVGPCHWRIRRVTTAEIIQAGGAFLLAAQRLAPDAPDARQLQEKLRKEPAQLASGARFQEALVAASVAAVSRDGTEWMECRIVLDAKQESASGGRIHVSSLPPGTMETLSAEILKLSKDGGAADERLSSFLGATASPPRRARK